MSQLASRTALVTGAQNGIGAAVAAELLGRGATVIAVDLRTWPDSAPAGSPRLHQLQCDVTHRPDVERCLERARNIAGPVDILVNNAGIYPFEPFESITLESWRRVFAVNVEGVMHFCQAVIPGMRARTWGRIINIGSNTFHMGIAGLTHYTASKGAVIGLTRALAMELGASGITVNVVAPTVTRTPGNQALFDNAPQIVDDVVSRQAIKRAGTPADIANAVTLLCGDEAGFITGQTIAADGGLAKL